MTHSIEGLSCGSGQRPTKKIELGGLKTNFLNSRFAVYRLPAGSSGAILRSDPGGAVKREVRSATFNLDLETLDVAPFLD